MYSKSEIVNIFHEILTNEELVEIPWTKKEIEIQFEKYINN